MIRVSDTTTRLANGQSMTGNRLAVPVLTPWIGDRSPEADTYRSRNAGRTIDVHEFLGIPVSTAAARWAPAQVAMTLPADPYDARKARVAPWQARTRSSRFGARPQQGDVGNLEFDEGGVVMSEDVGVVHVTTPDPLASRLLPVVIYIHGGSFNLNYANMPRTRGYGVAQAGGVYVSIEYPLGSFGFFDHADLPDHHEPNVALTYMMAALEWIVANIEAFGGDAKRMAIMGTSAGGASVQQLMPHLAQFGIRGALSIGGGGLSLRPSRTYMRDQARKLERGAARGFPGYLDDSRTIGQIGTESGRLAMLENLHPRALLAHMGARTQWTFEDGVAQSAPASFSNPYPVMSTFAEGDPGGLIRHRNTLGVVAAGEWPTSISFVAVTANNEASIINNGRDLSKADRDRLLTRARVTDPVDIGFIDDLIGEDDLPGLSIYTWMIFAFPAQEICRLFAERGGSAVEIANNYDTLGSGNSAPGHTSSFSYFTNNVGWRVAMGTDPTTLRVYENDLRLGEVLSSRLLAFAWDGDMNGDYVSPLRMAMYDRAPVLPDFISHAPGSIRSNVIRDALTIHRNDPEIVTTAYQAEAFDLFRKRYWEMPTALICSTEPGDAATLSGSGWSTAHPLANAQDPDPLVTARSKGVASLAKFAAALDGPQAVRVVGIARHNLTMGATIRIRGTLDGGTVFDRTIPAYEALYGTLELEWEDENDWFGGPSAGDLEAIPGLSILLLDAAVTVDTLTIWIGNPANPDGHVEIGRLLIGDAFEPVITMPQGIAETRQGTAPVRRSAQIELATGPDYDLRTGAQAVLRDRGMAGQVLFIAHPDDPVRRYRQSFLGELVPPTGVPADRERLAIRILEL